MTLPKERSYANSCLQTIIDGMGFIQRIDPQVPCLEDKENIAVRDSKERFVRDPQLALEMSSKCYSIWHSMTKSEGPNDLFEALHELFLACNEMAVKVHPNVAHNPSSRELQEVQISELLASVRNAYAKFVHIALCYLDAIEYDYSGNYLVKRAKLFVEKISAGSEFSLDEYDDTYLRIRREIIAGSYLTTMCNPAAGGFWIFRILDNIPLRVVTVHIYLNNRAYKNESNLLFKNLYEAYDLLTVCTRIENMVRAYCDFVLEGMKYIGDNGGINGLDLDFRMAYLMYRYLFERFYA